jgi:hypothetical protein
MCVRNLSIPQDIVIAFGECDYQESDQLRIQCGHQVQLLVVDRDFDLG